MKKILLTISLIAAFSLTANSAQFSDGCGPNASAISSSCWSGCVSVTSQAPLTGILSVDINRVGPRKPTAAEYKEAQRMLDARCALSSN